MMLSLTVPKPLAEVNPMLDVLNEDNEGWTFVTRWRPKNKGKSY